ncbi:hypothetical protein X766_15975 [Mesorhizobium sp. LSJC255A00]|uniref:hypothetical protein n=1 Tax=Mesorhizobium sp. LSJC255A00 TaxID=1287313 RepID=UPI0003CED0E1|nr:hypothetical protein [Mesorhizobium sp. LSJC255A00]ESX17888.1 hypothetical protein X766_15975 [Mesorhizobium sp. LSJC255A00]
MPQIKLLDLTDAEVSEILGEEPEEMTVGLDNGLTLPVTMMLDKDGNPTDIVFDATTLLAGSAALGWYEIDVADGSWSRPLLH